MFSKLIEKIRLLLDNPEYSEKARGMRWRFGLEEAVDSAIKLIEAFEPPELDAPNEEGWYFFDGEIMGEKTQCFIQVKEQYWGTAYMRPSTESIHSGRIDDIRHVKGKWIKAIVPKEDNK